MRAFNAILLLSIVMIAVGCASTDQRQSGIQGTAEEARTDAAAVDAAFWCPDDWRAAESLMQQAMKLMETGQRDLGEAAMRQAIQLYHNAAECASMRYRQQQMPLPQPFHR